MREKSGKKWSKMMSKWPYNAVDKGLDSVGGARHLAGEHVRGMVGEPEELGAAPAVVDELGEQLLVLGALGVLRDADCGEAMRHA